MTLDQLRGLDKDGTAEDAWATERAGMTGWLDGPGAAGQTCDASIVPVVSGHVDPGVLDRLAAALLPGTPPVGRTHLAAVPGTAGPPGTSGTAGAACGPGLAGRGAPMSPARWRRAERAARQLILRAAADLLSGPAGLAACLRTRTLDGQHASVSLPLDIGAATDTIPVHLRRAVTARDRHCRFPGCHQPPAACHPHHLIPRSQGGRTSLAGMLLLCSFPPPDRRAPVGLGHHLAPRRHRHRHQPRRHPDPAQPRAPRPRRLTSGGKHTRRGNASQQARSWPLRASRGPVAEPGQPARISASLRSSRAFVP